VRKQIEIGHERFPQEMFMAYNARRLKSISPK
jgi:hypothetical protein